MIMMSAKSPRIQNTTNTTRVMRSSWFRFMATANSISMSMAARPKAKNLSLLGASFMCLTEGLSHSLVTLAPSAL